MRAKWHTRTNSVYTRKHCSAPQAKMCSDYKNILQTSEWSLQTWGLSYNGEVSSFRVYLELKGTDVAQNLYGFWMKNIFGFFFHPVKINGVQCCLDALLKPNNYSGKIIVWPIKQQLGPKWWKFPHDSISIRNAEDVRSNGITKHLKNLIQGVFTVKEKISITLTTPRWRKLEPSH